MCYLKETMSYGIQHTRHSKVFEGSNADEI
jgi:hypothetical protein